MGEGRERQGKNEKELLEDVDLEWRVTKHIERHDTLKLFFMSVRIFKHQSLVFEAAMHLMLHLIRLIPFFLVTHITL